MEQFLWNYRTDAQPIAYALRDDEQMPILIDSIWAWVVRPQKVIIPSTPKCYQGDERIVEHRRRGGMD